MGEDILYVREVGKRKDKPKPKKAFPTIKRVDLMEGILSPELDKATRLKLSNLYAEITYAEMTDSKYMSEIVVSSKDDLELYNILRYLNKQKKAKM
ncbi:MAG: hypothetical protein HDQ99_19890 [Lachnospiraceae bacterium]|nr:hypothetical protein [Lachnospiraceae bacterium]